MILRIFDVSQLAHIAYDKFTLSFGVRQGRGQYQAREMYCGGLSYALSLIDRYYDENTHFVFTFDSVPTYRRELYRQLYHYGEYKGNRPSKGAPLIQQYKLIFNVLKSLNFTVLKKDGFESDDIIYNVVKQFHTFYDRIFVHTNDSDQYFLIDEKVTIIPVKRNCSVIDVNNYVENVSSNRYVKYNTILLDKIIHGDASDAIRKINDQMADRILDTIPEEIYPMLGNPTFLRNLIKIITKNDKRVMLATDLILPMLIDEELEIITTELDYDLFSFYAHFCSSIKRYRNAYVHSDIGCNILNEILEGND